MTSFLLFFASLNFVIPQAFFGGLTSINWVCFGFELGLFFGAIAVFGPKRAGIGFVLNFLWFLIDITSAQVPRQGSSFGKKFLRG